METKDDLEWMVYPGVRAAVGHSAALAAYAAVVVAVLGVADPLLWICGAESLAGICRNSSDMLFCLWFAVMGALALWCHYVLLAERGNKFTRLVCIAAALLGVFLLVGTFYTCVVRELFLSYQLDLPFYLSLLWFVSSLLNINNMAAAPLRLRICLPISFFLSMLCGLMFGIYELILPYTILKVAACALFFRPLQQLRRISPRIISMPPVE